MAKEWWTLQVNLVVFLSCWNNIYVPQTKLFYWYIANIGKFPWKCSNSILQCIFLLGQLQTLCSIFETDLLFFKSYFIIYLGIINCDCCAFVYSHAAAFWIWSKREKQTQVYGPNDVCSRWLHRFSRKLGMQ